jgi:DNA-binding winged helix-turn-helix (wHTH) protein
MANSRTIPRESISVDSTAGGSRSVSIHRITSSTKPVKRPITVSITPSPRTLRTKACAAAALPADLSDLEGVIHSLLLSAFEKIADRMSEASLRSDDRSRRPFPIAERDSCIEPSARSPAEPRETMLRVGSLELDLINRTAKRGNRPIDLLPSEFRLLKYMMQRGGQLLTRAKLLQDVWQYKFLPETNLVDVHMGRLRRKVNGPNEAPMIGNVRGAGFVLSATPPATGVSGTSSGTR